MTLHTYSIELRNEDEELVAYATVEAQSREHALDQLDIEALRRYYAEPNLMPDRIFEDE